MDIYIRPLKEEDALISYKWRNDPDIWQFTEKKPDKYITPEIELNWIRQVLQKNNEKRFAICIKETNEYIGNTQLTSITNDSAEFHIFIGEKKYWGMGIAKKALQLIIQYAFEELKLKYIYLKVNKNNIRAIKVYIDSGFYIVSEDNTNLIMELKNLFLT